MLTISKPLSAAQALVYHADASALAGRVKLKTAPHGAPAAAHKRPPWACMGRAAGERAKPRSLPRAMSETLLYGTETDLYAQPTVRTGACGIC